MRFWNNTSVTQMEKYRDCARKWYLDKIVGLPAPKSPSAERGIHGHEAIETDAKRMIEIGGISVGGDPILPTIDEGPFQRYVEVARQYGPRPGEPAGIEIEITMPTAPGLPPLIGKVDVFLFDRDPIRIIDWKFISDARYAKTSTELYDDLQTNVYTEWVYQEIERRGHEHQVVVPDSVNIGLVYFVVGKDPAKVPKKGPKHLPVFVDLSRKNTARVWAGAIETTREMVEVSKLPSKDDVKPNPLACTKYGGCPYRANCGLPLFSGFGSNKKEIDVSFYQQMVDKGMVNGQNGAGVPANGAGAPAQQQGWPGAGAGGAPAQQPQQGWPGASAGGAPAQQPQQGWPGAAAPAAAPQGAQGILSPDAPSRETGAEPEPGAAPAAEGGKRRGRKKAEAAPALNVSAPLTEERFTAMNPGPAPTSISAGETPATSDTFDSFELYVDCWPVKHPNGAGATNFDDWIHPIVRDLNEHVAQPPPTGKGVPDFRALPYSEEKMVFNLALTLWIQRRGLPPSLFVLTSSPLSRDALAILTPYATSVVRAVR